MNLRVMSPESILKAVKAGKVSVEVATAELISREKSEGSGAGTVTVKARRIDTMFNTKKKNPKTQKMEEVQEPGKGNVSVYGLGRFPVTLYPDGWRRLLEAADSIKNAIAENRDALSYRSDAQAQAVDAWLGDDE